MDADALYTFQRPPASDGAHVRGSLFAPTPLFVKQYLGEARWEEFLLRVEPLARAAMEAEMVALGWYPFGIITSAVDVFAAMGKEKGLRALAYHNLDYSTRGIFKAIFKLGSPDFMVSRSEQIWQKYYSSGRMTVETVSRGEAVVRLHEFRELTPRYSQVVLHGIEAVIVKAGGSIMSAEISKDIPAGDRFSEYRLTWR